MKKTSPSVSKKAPKKAPKKMVVSRDKQLRSGRSFGYVTKG